MCNLVCRSYIQKRRKVRFLRQLCWQRLTELLMSTTAALSYLCVSKPMVNLWTIRWWVLTVVPNMCTIVYSYRILALQENFLLQFKIDVSCCSSLLSQSFRSNQIIQPVKPNESLIKCVNSHFLFYAVIGVTMMKNEINMEKKETFRIFFLTSTGWQSSGTKPWLWKNIFPLWCCKYLP